MLDRNKIMSAIAGLTIVYQIIVISGLPNLFGVFIPAASHGAVSLMLVLALIFLKFDRSQNESADKARWFDVPILTLGLIGAGFVAFFYYSHVVDYAGYGYVDTLGMLMAGSLAIALLEAVRRLTGWVLPILIIVLLLIASFQSYLPGLLHGPRFDTEQLLYAIYVGTSGIFGLPLAVATSIIIVFLIYGQLLQQSGAGEWLMKLADALTGWSRGGPAKASVVASAFLGSFSGSPSSNTASSGVITIPLMKKIGFTPAFAGAVEATASTGGMILPPVMGAVAFIMAEWLGVGYVDVVIAAVIPALLYYFVVFMSVHFNALRMGIPVQSRKDLPAIWPTFLEGWYYVLPILTLFYFLIIAEQRPEVSALYSIPVVILCSFFSKNKENWLTFKNLWQGFVDSTKGWLVIVVVTASVGMVIGSLQVSGLVVKLSGFIVDAGMGNLLLTLILVGVASIILGMGLDVISAYITLAVLTAPALIALGVTPMQAHLFVVFWSLTSFLTPPVCLAVYVACGISGSKVWETGFHAMRLGAAAFLGSIAFVYDPALIMHGTVGEIALAVSQAILAGILLAASLQGYGFSRMSVPVRIIVFCAGAVLLAKGAIVYAIAAAILLVAVLLQIFENNRNKKLNVPENL